MGELDALKNLWLEAVSANRQSVKSLENFDDIQRNAPFQTGEG